MNSHNAAKPIEQKVSAIKPPLERVGEAAYFLGVVGSTETVSTFHHTKEGAKAIIGRWWNDLHPRHQLYFAQYLRCPAAFDFILYPDYYRMSGSAQAALLERLRAAIAAAMHTLENATPQGGRTA